MLRRSRDVIEFSFSNLSASLLRYPQSYPMGNPIVSFTKHLCCNFFLLLAALGLLIGRPALGQTIQSMHLLANQSGWLLVDGRLFWTDTLGAQWTEITPAIAGGSAIAGVYFDEAGNGWAFEVATDPRRIVVAHTADKGAHWSYSAIASPFDDAHPFGGQAYPYFLDAQHGWVMFRLQSGSAFRPGLLFHTEDGGAHWAEMPRPPMGGDLVFTDAAHGWMGPGLEGDEMYHAANSGQSWQRVDLPAPASKLQGVTSRIGLPDFRSFSQGVLLRTYTGDNGITVVRYETDDAGATWTPAFVLQNTIGALAALAADGTVNSRVRAQMEGSRTRLPLSPEATGAMMPERATFVTQSAGWVLFAGGNCAPETGICTQSKALLGTLDGGESFFRLGALPGIPLETTKTIALPKGRSGLRQPQDHASPEAQSDSSLTLTGVMGFDTCNLMTTTQMQTWYTSSPYRVVGAYIGGDSFACPSSLSRFTSSWTSTVLGMGWEIIPIWVGPQAPGGNYSNLISTNTTTANSQGVTEADSAVAAMVARSMNQGSPIVYDMEAYSYDNSTYVAATQAFLEGWTTELHAKGYLSAVYSSHPEFNNWLPGLINPATDDIWFAYFFNSGVPCGTACQTVYLAQTSTFTLPSNVWTNHHRMRQTSSGFDSTYGTLTYNIDEDWVDAAMVVATPNTLTVTENGTGTGTIVSTQIGSTESTDVSLDTQIDCGTTCSANFAATDIVTLQATPAAGSSFTSWSGCDMVSSDQCTVTVSSSRTVTATFSASAPVTGMPGFTAAVSSPSLTIRQGQSGTDTLTITQQGAYKGTLSFACSGLPSDASCSFNPATLTATGNSATLTTTLTMMATDTSAQLAQRRLPFEFALLLPLGLAPFVLRRKRMGALYLMLTFAVYGLGLATLATGCGGGGSSTIYTGTANVVITSGSGQTQVPVQLTITR